MHTLLRSGCGVALMLVSVSGCGGDAKQTPKGEPSAELQAPLAAAREALSSDTAPNADLQVFNDLSSRIWHPDRRDAASRQILQSWRNDPGGFLWLDLARTAASRGFLPDPAVRDSLLALPALNDTTTAVGCYALASAARSRAQRLALLHEAEVYGDALPSLDRVWLERQLAFYASSAGQPLAAVDTLIAWLPVARRAGGPALEYFLWNDIARDLRRAGRLGDALAAATMAEAMARRAGSSYRALQAGRRIAFILDNMGDTQAALDRYETCLVETRQEDHPALVVLLLNQIAAIQAREGDHRASLTAHRENLALNLAIADTVNAIRNLCNVSYSQRMLGEIDSSGVYQRRTEDWLRRHGSARLARELTPWLCEYHFHVGDYAAIDSLLATVAGGGEDADSVDERAKILLTMLRQGLESGQPDLAYWAIAELETLRDRLHDTAADYSLLADAGITSADFLARQGEQTLAAETLQEARAVVVRQGGEYAQWDLERSTFELALLGSDFGTAAFSADRCLEIAVRRDDADLILTSRELLGRLALKTGDFAAARRYFRFAETDSSYGGNHRARLASLINLGVVESRAGQAAEAMRLFSAAADLFTERPPDDLAARLDYEIGRVHLAAGELRDAEASFLNAFELLTSNATGASQSAMGFHASALREITEALIGLYKDAPDLLERGTMAVRALKLAEACRWRVASAEAVQESEFALPELSEPAIVYFVGSERSFVWVLGGGSCTIHDRPGRAAFEETLVAVLADLATPGGLVDAEAVAKLSGMLLNPVVSVWAPEQTLLIVPDDLLASVPWYALANPSGAGRVLDHGPVVVMPSVASLGTTTSAPRGPLLAIGVDTPDATGLNELRRAEAEARSVAGEWRGGDAVLKVGEDATWPLIAALELDRFQVIHFSTHAVAHQGTANRATLRLAAADGSQPLTLQTVRDLCLDANLIYLSCCEAARRLEDGGGVFSFVRAFLAAGADAVIAPTIRVDDEASMFLAGRFYEHWQGGMNKAAALRAALRDLRDHDDRWRHPFYWGFYRLTGAG